MAILLDPDDFTDIKDAATLVNEIDAKVLGEVPCLEQAVEDPATLARASAILTRVLRRWAAQGWASYTSYAVDGVSQGGLTASGDLTENEWASLRRLCADSDRHGLRPAGQFPPPRRLFDDQNRGRLWAAS